MFRFGISIIMLLFGAACAPVEKVPTTVDGEAVIALRGFAELGFHTITLYDDAEASSNFDVEKCTSVAVGNLELLGDIFPEEPSFGSIYVELDVIGTGIVATDFDDAFTVFIVDDWQASIWCRNRQLMKLIRVKTPNIGAVTKNE